MGFWAMHFNYYLIAELILYAVSQTFSVAGLKKQAAFRCGIRVPADSGTIYFLSAVFLFSHGWFATPHDVLQADWQEVWHSPQPPFFVLSFMSLVSIVLILFMIITSL
jgi:hypothetical protein